MLGPITQLPEDMVRPDVLLCFGEDRDDWATALHDAGARPQHRHHYRGIEAWSNDERLTLLAPWGSAAVEAVLWELTAAPVARIVLWGTAGALPGWTGHTAHAIDPATSHGVAMMPDGTTTRPTMHHTLPTAPAVSTDRFYGASPTSADPRYGDPTLWPGIQHGAAMIDMETAPFYAMMERFAPEVERLAVRAVANPVAALETMPAGAPQALAAALDAAMDAFQ